jgi:hypothetical protein
MGMQSLNCRLQVPNSLVCAVWCSDLQLLPLLSSEQRQSVSLLFHCLAGQPHLLDWMQRQVCITLSKCVVCLRALKWMMHEA